MSETLERETPRVSVFGVPLDALTMDATVERCRELIEAGAFAQHVVLNASKVVMMSDDSSLTDIVRSCDLVNADGQSVVWAARLLGKQVPERVAGIDLMERLLELAETMGWPVYFLGATSEVLREFINRVELRYPQLAIAGARDGYFTDDAEVAGQVAASGARLLFVGISSPRKEKFLAAQRSRLGQVFAMGVGGSFDVWAGKSSRAPKWMQRLGLEWFHRFLQEPRRMWKRYLIGNTKFAVLVMHEMVKVRRDG